LNQNIIAKTVRLISEEGKQIGVVSLEEARRKAAESKLDLVEISGTAKPPVIRLVNFKKFKYEEEKKERLSKRKTRETDTKEIWLSPNISDHDLDIRIQRASEFLQAGDRVKLTVKFAGREIAHPERGHQVLSKAQDLLKEAGEKDSEPRMLGRALVINIKPVKK